MALQEGHSSPPTPQKVFCKHYSRPHLTGQTQCYIPLLSALTGSPTHSAQVTHEHTTSTTWQKVAEKNQAAFPTAQETAAPHLASWWSPHHSKHKAASSRCPKVNAWFAAGKFFSGSLLSPTQEFIAMDVTAPAQTPSTTSPLGVSPGGATLVAKNHQGRQGPSCIFQLLP